MPRRKIGVIGLGNMGSGIAESFLRAGVPLAVWDVSAARLAPFEKHRGAAIAEPGVMAATCAVIFFAVPATPEVETCLKGRRGILANARKGLVIYDLTTSDPAASKKLARRAGARGIAYLDAGMSGGAQAAARGGLTLMIGGDKRAFARTRDYLAVIADMDKVFHVGSSGAGHTLKLIHNMVVHSTFVATAEAGRMAEKAGIELATMTRVFNAGNARSFISERRFPDHILSNKWDGKSRVHNLHKDLAMAVDLARRLGVEAGVAAGTLDFLTRAVARGMEDDDFTLLYRDFDKIGKSGKKP